MTDHRAEAEKLMAEAVAHPDPLNGLNHRYVRAGIHADLALVDSIERLAPRLLGQMDPTPVIPAGTYSDPTATVPAYREPDLDDEVRRLLASYPALQPGDERELAETIAAEALARGMRLARPVTHASPTVFDEIRDERALQIAQSWTFEHDQRHGLAHLYDLINSYLLKPHEHPHRDERERLIVVAALCVAAIDLLDGEASV